jgi:fatty acid desaturase
MAVTTEDRRLATVAWRDLVALAWWEKAWEVALPLPWLAVSLVFYQQGWVVAGAAASFFFFLTGLRASHNAQHYCIGIGKRGHDTMLAILSVLMMGSMHAVQVTHLHHHRHCLDDEDFEAAHANWAGWRVLVGGPIFPVRLHFNAWRIGAAAKRRWIAAELALIAGAALAALLPIPLGLRWHTAAMIAGECFTGFFAVWTVHHGCDAAGQVARTQRGWLKNLLSYSMFYHLEHHLFPAVPTCHLPRLAERLDRAAPEMNRMRVF